MMYNPVKFSTAVFMAFLLSFLHIHYVKAQVIKVATNHSIKKNRNSEVYFEIPVSVTRELGKKQKDDIVLYIERLGGSNLDTKHYTIINSSLVFPAREVLYDTITVTKIFLLKLVPDSITSEERQLLLQVKGDTSNNISPVTTLVTVKPAPKPIDSLDRNSPVRWAVGANFDFLDGLKPNHLYTSLNLFLPTLLGKRKNFGFYLNMSRNRYANMDSVGNRTFTYYELTANKDSTRRIRESYTQKKETTTNTLGIFIAPTFRLNDSLDNFAWFVHAHLGGLQLQETDKYTYTALSSDTVILPGTQTPRKYNRPEVVKRPSYDTYFGGGLTLVHRYKTIEINFSPTFGFGNNRSHIKGTREVQPFYLVQFSVTELKSGFTLGSELRAFAPEDYPMISIHLAKVFDVVKVGDAIFK